MKGEVIKMNTNERYKLFTLLNKECKELYPYYFKRKHIKEIHEKNKIITYIVNNFLGQYMLVVMQCNLVDFNYYCCILSTNDNKITNEILATFTLYEPILILSED